MFPSDQQRPLPQRPLNNEAFRQHAEYYRQMAADWRRENRIGDAWLQWEYSPEEWALFDAVDYRPGWRITIALLVGLLCCVPFTLPFAFDPHVWGLGVLVGGGVASFTALLLWGILRAKPRQRRLARQKPGQPHRVTFAAQGVWIAGTHFSFTSLDKVKLTAQPAVLYFHLTETDNDGSVRTWSMRVLAPRGHEAEAASLAQRYQAMLDDEQKRLERLNNPPEPLGR